MGAYRRKYTREFKIEMVERVLQGHTTLEVAKANDLYPGLITKWKREYMDGKFHGSSTNDIELKNLRAKICELEQMIGKLTMEVYLLKKEKKFALAMRKESLSLVTGPNSDRLKEGVS